MQYLCSLIVLLFAFSSTLLSQEKLPELITDRPDQTESAAVIPVGYFQIETGFSFEGDEAGGQKTNSLNLFSTLGRIGLIEDLELRFGVNYNSVSTEVTPLSTSSLDGLNDYYLGLKYMLIHADGLIPDVAVIVSSGLPFGDEAIGNPGRFEPSVLVAVAKDLDDRLSLGVNLAVDRIGNPYVNEYFYSSALGVGLTDNLGCFVELYGVAFEDMPPQNSFDGGVTWLLYDNFQFDASLGIGLTEAAPDYFISTGFSMILNWRSTGG